MVYLTCPYPRAERLLECAESLKEGGLRLGGTGIPKVEHRVHWSFSVANVMKCWTFHPVLSGLHFRCAWTDLPTTRWLAVARRPWKVLKLLSSRPGRLLSRRVSWQATPEW